MSGQPISLSEPPVHHETYDGVSVAVYAREDAPGYVWYATASFGGRSRDGWGEGRDVDQARKTGLEQACRLRARIMYRSRFSVRT